MERLKKRTDFLRTARGYKWVMPGLVLQARARHDGDGETPPARIGFTASRRVGGAVQRNRARRRLREAVRSTLAPLARPGYDYVLIARQGTLTRPWAALTDDLAHAANAVHRKAAGNRAHSHSIKRGLN